MKYFEFGQENPEIMVLFHGGGISYKATLPTARILAKKYHVILNAYDGFNPSEPETEYKSAMDEARRMGITYWKITEERSISCMAFLMAAEWLMK